MFRWLSKNILYCVIVIIGFVSISGFQSRGCHAQSATSESSAYPELNEQQRETASQLVLQLSDPKFSVRQRVSDQLWEMGPSVIPLLETQLDSSSVEASTRAKRLLSLLRHNILPDAAAEIVELVIQYSESEGVVQERILHRLIDLDRIWLALGLIRSTENESVQFSIFSSTFSVERLAKEYVVANRTEDLERLLAHPVVRKFTPEVPMFYLWQQGRMDDFVAELKTKLVDDPENFTLRDRLLLVGLLRFKKQYGEAIEYAEDIEESGLRYRLIHTMFMESGNWAALANVVVDSENENEVDESSYFASVYQKALIYYYANEHDKLDETIVKMELAIADRESLLREEKEQNGEPDDSRYYRILQLEAELKDEHKRLGGLLMYLLDWERAKKHLPLKRDQDSMDICLSVNRYELLFQTMGIGGDFQQRKRAFERRLRKIKSLFVEAEQAREKEQVGWEEKSEELDEERMNEVALYSALAGQMAHLGFEEEAEYYLRQLYFETADQRLIEYRADIIETLVEIGAHATVWELVDQYSDEASEFELYSVLFPGPQNPHNPSYKKNMAQELNHVLAKKYPDIKQRMRKIAHFVKSPLRLTDEEFDFDDEIQIVRRSATSDYSVAFLMFDLCNLHSEKASQEEANFWLEKSAESPRALYSKQRMARLHYRKSEFKEAAELYESLGRMEDSSIYWGQAGEAYRKAGNEIRSLEMDLMMAMSFSDSQRQEIAKEFFAAKLNWKLADWYRLRACLASGDLSTERYMLSMSTISADGKVPDVDEAYNRSRMMRLHNVDSPYVSPVSWATQGVRDMGYAIRSLIENDRFDEAITRLGPLNDFSPADPSLAEFAMPLLQQKGASQQADEMFTKLSGGFFDTLKMFPNSSLHNNNYAWMCACAKRKLEFVERHAKRAVEQRPGSAGYLDTLAEVYYAQGDFDQAITTIQKSIELVPSREYYHQQLARFREAKRLQGE